jgi:hypothetical protein
MDGDAAMISREAHAVLDGVSAAALMLGPTALGWPREVRGSVAAAGAGVAAYSLLTRYGGKKARPLSMRQHLVLDALQGAGFCAAAFLLDREPPGVRLALGGYGLFSLAAALMTDGADDFDEIAVPWGGRYAPIANRPSGGHRNPERMMPVNVRT